MSGHLRRLPALVLALLLGGLALAPVTTASADPGDPPVIGGVPRVGGPLTAIAGYDAAPGTLDYQWYADGNPVGPNAAIFRPGTAEVGAEITVSVTFDDDPDTTATSAPTTRVLQAGRVTAWGYDNLGQASAPSSVTSADVVADVAAGLYHSLAVTTAGDVVGWGYDPLGQVSSAPPGDYVAVAAGAYHSLGLTTAGTVVAWGDNTFGESSVPGSLAGKTVVAIAAGVYHSLALTSDGQVTAWGEDPHGQVSIPAALTGKTVLGIGAYGYSSAAVTSDGAVDVWGDSSYGQVDSEPAGEFSAVAPGQSHVLALGTDGVVAGWGFNGSGQSVPPPTLTGKTVTTIDAGENHSLVATSDGQVVAFGDDFRGQVTVPTSLATRFVTGVAAGGSFSVAISVPRLSSPAPLKVTGLLRVGELVTAKYSVPAPTPDQVTFTWYTGGTPLPGPAGASQYLGAAELGTRISVRVTFTKAGYPPVSATSPATVPVTAAAFTGALTATVLGVPRVGRTLTASVSTPSPGPDQLTYTWLANGAPIPGAGDSTFDLTPAQLGTRISVRVTATKAGYTPVSTTSPLSGTVR